MSEQQQQPPLLLGAPPSSTSNALVTSSSPAATTTTSAVAATSTNEPRVPTSHTLQEALKFSISAAGGQPQRSQNELPVMSDEDKQFLSRALDSLQGDTSALTDVIAKLGNSHTTAETLCGILDGLSEYADDIDFAIGLKNLHGLEPTLHLTAHSHPEVKWRALQLIAQTAQNNPEVQSHFATIDALSTITPLISSDNEKVQFKALSAISCLVRGHSVMATKFLTTDGPSVLRACLRLPSRVRAKAFYLMKCLLQQSRDTSEYVLQPETLDVVFSVLPDSDDEVWEQALGMLMLCPKSNLGNQSHQEALTALLASRKAHLETLSADDELRSQLKLLAVIGRILVVAV